MSTVDPAQVRADRANAWQASPASGALLFGMAILLTISAIALGFGMMVMADMSRIMSLNSVFADWTSNLDGHFWTFPVGLTGTILATMGMMFAAKRATGRPLSFPVLGPFPITLIGVAIGVSLAAPMLTAPLTVGVRTDPTFFEDEPWGGGEWFWYAVSWWGPLLAWTLAAVGIVIAIVFRRRRAAQRRSLDELLVTGRITVGNVTESPVPSAETSNLIGSITVRFDDADGVTRWAKTTGAWHVSSIPWIGQTVAVLFDPADPGNVRRIWIAPSGSRTADDFSRWKLGS